MAETTKKATKKPRTTKARTAAVPRTASKMKASNVMMMASHEEIAALAHRYWKERGGQHGSDREDWFRAEQELLGKAS